jgi:hypothetical protein
MKCHYERCQEEASPWWRCFRFAAPLCDDHANTIHAIVELPDVNAPGAWDKLAEQVNEAGSHIRSDFEFDACAPDRRPELS